MRKEGLRGEDGEATDVGEEDGDVVVLLDVDLVELCFPLKPLCHVVLHLHCDVPGQDGEEEAFLEPEGVGSGCRE